MTAPGLLDAALGPPGFVADPALAAVLAALPEARLVGGCVRDALAGVAVADIDLAVPAPPDRVMAALEAAGLRAVPTGLAHGTVTAVSLGRGFQVTSLRRDVATDGRHAIVAFTDDWRQDAARRDFTINAMSMTRAGEVFDYFEGRADLQAGRLRFIGDPATRLAEDRLRVLRYFRFFARYGAVPPDASVQAALRAAVPDLAALSVERVWAECKRILAAAAPLASLCLMVELGVFQAVLPEAAELDRLAALVAQGAPADPLLRLAALLPPGAPSPAGRWRFSTAEAARLDALRGPLALPATPSDHALRGLLAQTAPDVALGRLWLAGAPEGVRQRLLALPAPVFPLAGRDVVAQGIAPGPAIGAMLARLRDRWRDGGCIADRATCMAWLEEQTTHPTAARQE